LHISLVKVAGDILDTRVAVEASFLRGELAGACELAQVVDGGAKHWRQLLHREEMGCGLFADFQVAVQAQLDRQSDQINDRLVVSC
jgi:hypothetical protein